jgi:type VI protein secretion system component VasF
VALFKKNRQFNIKPKYQNETDSSQEKDIQSKWQELKQSRSRKSSILTSPLYMVLFLIALLVLWYFLSGYE